jgi:hypothetical protein
MANWSGNCGYCKKTGSGSLPKYVCPVCQRTGCSTCMPEAGVTKCDQCQEAETREESENPRAR